MGRDGQANEAQKSSAAAEMLVLMSLSAARGSEHHT